MHQHDHNSSIQFQTLLFTFLSGDEKGKNYLRSIRLTGDNRALSHAIVHIPADTRSAFPVISVQSPVSIQCCWQS